MSDSGDTGLSGPANADGLVPGELRVQLAEAYRLGELIGSGSFGMVFRGEQLSDNEPVAIKVYLSQGPYRHSLNELRMLFRMQHPHVIRVLDLYYTRKSYCLVFEYMPAGDLRLRMQQAMPVAEAIVIAAQIADGLAYIHTQGIVHRDLKPENVLLQRQGETMVSKLADFNLARFARSGLAPGHYGTPLYMAPEQFYTHSDHRADLYALGVVLYEMLTGRPPFEGGRQELMRAHLQQEPDLQPCPAALRSFLRDLLAKDPDRRPANAGEVGARLRRLLKSGYASLIEMPNPDQGRPEGAFYLKYLDSPLRRYCYYVLSEQPNTNDLP